MAILRSLVSGAACVALCQAAHSPVKLDGYGEFSGLSVNSTLSGSALPAPVDAWLGIDYATQPVGERRFKPVDWPAPFEGVKTATNYGKQCIQDGDTSTQDEACLNFNVFRTQNVSLQQKLPVLVWIHGGAFVAGSYMSFDAASFVASSKEPVIAVSFHYRVGALGSLPSSLFKEEGLLNLGVRDQRQLLEFVQKHISSFGGDPDKVTLGGQSAGAHSVGIHYAHNYGQDQGKPLFAGVIHQSGSVTARSFPNATDPLYVKQMDKFMQLLDCSQDSNGLALACLRAADVNDIRDATSTIYNDYNAALTWPFQPVQGGSLFERYGSESGYDGTFFHVPSLNTHAANEGFGFVPTNLETNEEFLDYFRNISPELTQDDTSLLQSLYPDPATDPDSPYVGSTNSTQFTRLATAWGDYAYICPVQETAYIAATAGVPSWKARFNTNNSFPAWQGIPHSADAGYVWNEPTVDHQDIAHAYHAYFASFVVSGDPNTHRYPGTPEWPAYEPSDSEAALQLLVQPDDMKAIEDTIRREECLYWRDPERAPRLRK